MLTYFLNLLKISITKRKTILEKLEQLKLDPYKENNNIKKLVGYNGYRLRVGDYRIIYRIDKGSRIGTINTLKKLSIALNIDLDML